MKIRILILYFSSIIFLSSCTTNSESYKSARYYFGLNIDKNLEPVLYEDIWFVTGEGYVNIIYEFDSVSNAAFLKNNKLSEYNNLPIDIKRPINMPKEIANYLPPKLYHQFYIRNEYEYINHVGKYKITSEKGELSSSIVLYDEELMKLYMHYTVDNNKNQ